MKYEKYLSFGFNCELSNALSLVNVFTPSIFSWADVRGTDALKHGIINPDSIFSQEHKRYSNNMFFCTQTQIGFHGRIKFNECKLDNGETDEIKIQESLKELKSRINYLSKKTDELLINKNCLVIIKWFSDIFKENYTPKSSGDLIKNVLEEKYKKNINVLVVYEKSENICEWSEIGFNGREISRIAPRSDTSNIDHVSWKKILYEFI